MTESERQRLLEKIIGQIVDVTELEIEDTDTGVFDSVPAIGKVRRYRTNKQWLDE